MAAVLQVRNDFFRKRTSNHVDMTELPEKLPEGFPWRKLAEPLGIDPRVASDSVRQRYLTCLAPGIIKGNWQPDEDAIIYRERAAGKGWAAMSGLLPGRPALSIQNRWNDTLKKDTKRVEAAERAADPEVVAAAALAAARLRSQQRSRVALVKRGGLSDPAAVAAANAAAGAAAAEAAANNVKAFDKNNKEHIAVLRGAVFSAENHARILDYKEMPQVLRSVKDLPSALHPGIDLERDALPLIKQGGLEMPLWSLLRTFGRLVAGELSPDVACVRVGGTRGPETRKDISNKVNKMTFRKKVLFEWRRRAEIEQIRERQRKAPSWQAPEAEDEEKDEDEGDEEDEEEEEGGRGKTSGPSSSSGAVKRGRNSSASAAVAAAAAAAASGRAAPAKKAKRPAKDRSLKAADSEEEDEYEDSDEEDEYEGSDDSSDEDEDSYSSYDGTDESDDDDE